MPKGTELMDEIIVNLADGTQLKFPLGTPDSVIDSAVKRTVAEQGGMAAQSPAEPIGLGGEALLSATQAGFDAMGAESGRGRKMGDIFNATLTGDQSLSEGSLQAMGEGVNYLGDLGMAGVAKVGQGISAMTPEPVKEFAGVVGDEVMTQLGIFFDQPLMQMGKRALQAGGEAWDEFSRENPRAARNISAITSIAGLGTGGAAGASTKTGKRILSAELPSTRRMREAKESIEQGGMAATRDETAPFRIEEIQREPFAPEGTRAVGAADEAVEGANTLPVEYVAPRRIVKSPVQQEAVRQGFDEGLVAMIREASPADRREMLRALQVMENSTKNKRYSLTNRPTDIAGRSMLDRYKVIEGVNRRAGKGIDDFAEKNLKGQRVDFSGPVQSFEDDLRRMGITLKDDLTVDFTGSTIEGAAGAERIINQLVKRMRSPRDITAYEVHNLKRFIDDQVTYGKLAEGLSGSAERVVKDLRRQLDSVLDNQFPDYDRLNTTYAETIQAMDNFKSAIGRTIDPDSKSAATAIGTSLRGVGSNRQTRGRLLDSLDEMQEISGRYGEFDDDILTQAAFTMDLDKMFGTKADTSLMGQVGSAIATDPTSKSNVVTAAAKGAIDKVRGINQEAQFRAMEALLKSFDN